MKEFKIIKFEPDGKRYYPSSVELIDLDNGNYIKHTDIEIPLGKSRYGGPIIDLPPDVGHPENMEFVCQLDLKYISRYDEKDLLPKSGQLIVFSDISNDIGMVIYANIDNNELNRIIVEHENHFWDGVLFKEVNSSVEFLSERYRFPEDDWEKENLKHLLNAEGKMWDEFAGVEQSKMFGIFTHCQFKEKEVLDKINKGKIVLIQFGENGFNDEGVFSILIDKNDLEKLNFNNCEFYWSQS